MMQVSFHHKDTGLFDGQHMLLSDDNLVALNTPKDHVAVSGWHDHLSRRMNVATGEIEDYRPPAPSSEHEWNSTSRRWRPNQALAARINAHTTALMRIAQLEASQQRPLREAALGDASAIARLQGIEDEIASLRARLIVSNSVL
jgi:hypothetical protein